jgi:hypothetical protein
MLTKILGYFFPRKKLYINFDYSGLGYILGVTFFTDSSGHPAQKGRKTAFISDPKEKMSEGTEISFFSSRKKLKWQLCLFMAVPAAGVWVQCLNGCLVLQL